MLRLLQLFLWSCLFACLIPLGVQAVSPVSLCTQTGCEDDGDKGVLSSDLQPLCFQVGGVSFRLLPVQGGKFRMGAENNDFKANNDEKPVHTVRVSDFYLGETEVVARLFAQTLQEEHTFVPAHLLYGVVFTLEIGMVLPHDSPPKRLGHFSFT